MRECRNRDGLHVVRQDEVTSCESRLAARELEQSEAPARARPDRGALGSPRGRDEVDAVAADALRDVHLLDRLLHLEERLAVDDGTKLELVCSALDPAPEHLHLVLSSRVAERRAQEEAVELGLRKRIGPLVLDRVLGRDDEERRLQPVRLALDRHLALLHRLEERGLRLRRSAVDLVGEEEVREDRARPELEVDVPLVPDGRARDVGGHQVGRELDAGEPHAQDLREGPRSQGLGQAGVVLEEDVAVREEPDEHELERVALPDDSSLDLVEDLLRELVHAFELH